MPEIESSSPWPLLPQRSSTNHQAGQPSQVTRAIQQQALHTRSSEQAITRHIVDRENQIAVGCPTRIIRATAEGILPRGDNFAIAVLLHAKNGTGTAPQMVQSGEHDQPERHLHDAAHVSLEYRMHRTARIAKHEFSGPLAAIRSKQLAAKRGK